MNANLAAAARSLAQSCAVLALLLLAMITNAQAPSRVPKVGFLGFSSAERDAGRFDAFKRGLGELGYVDGRNIMILQRYANGKAEALPALAAELVQLKVDLFVTEGTPAAQSAKGATSTIPIVMGNAGDPVGTGLVASLARPGGNVTGFSDLSSDLAAKRLQMLKEMAPSAVRVAVLFNPANPTNALEVESLRTAARQLGLTLESFQVGSADDVGRAFQSMKTARIDAFLLAGDAIFGLHRDHIIGLAAAGGLPAMYPARHFVDAGGLVSYGTNFENLFRRAAIYVDKILRGARPADLPVEQPIKFELVINAKTAGRLGLAIPRTVLLLSDEVIR